MADPLHGAELGQAGQVMEGPPVVSSQRGSSWLTAIGFGFLTLNTVMAIYRSGSDVRSIAFVAGSYVDLVLLFFYLMRLFEATPRDHRSPTESKLKACVWVLTTLLAVMFSYEVAAVMPLAAAVIIWAMAATAVVGVYYAFFRHT